MIAKNYVRFPEALRFQVELFSNGFHNSPRIMRLMEVTFDWRVKAPEWWTAAKNRARRLAKKVKAEIGDFFKELKVEQLSLIFEDERTATVKKPLTDEEWARLDTFSEWMDEIFDSKLHTTPSLTAYWGTGSKQWHLSAGRAYRLHCPTQKHAMYCGGFQYASEEGS